MARITITTDYCQVIEQFDITSGDFSTTLSRAALLDDLQEAVQRAEKIQAEEEKQEGV